MVSPSKHVALLALVSATIAVSACAVEEPPSPESTSPRPGVVQKPSGAPSLNANSTTANKRSCREYRAAVQPASDRLASALESDPTGVGAAVEATALVAAVEPVAAASGGELAKQARALKASYVRLAKALNSGNATAVERERVVQAAARAQVDKVCTSISR